MKCFVFKTIILGDCGVGKTTMLYKYYTGNFNYNNQSTVGVNFVSKYVKNIQCNVADLIKLQIWDTAGQERFRSIIRSYYHNVCGCIIAYDITKKNTFDNLSYWMDEVRKNKCVDHVFHKMVEIVIHKISKNGDNPEIRQPRGVVEIDDNININPQRTTRLNDAKTVISNLLCCNN